jgi:nucleotide-binding universal stress UspA family protein
MPESVANPRAGDHREASEEKAMIKDIIVNLPVGKSGDAAAHFAVSVAGRLNAQLTGIAFLYEPLLPPMIDLYALPADVMEAQRSENERTAKAAVASFAQASRRAGVAGETRVIEASVADAPGQLAQIARRFDLCVVAQPRPDEPALARLFVEAALFETGKPVLVVPYIQTAGLKLDRIMVCWDGSRSAARAVGDALPFIAAAKATEIVMVAGEPAKSDELSGADIAHHLARHGAKVEVRRIASSEIDIAATILSTAADESADLLVMGGYGHSRMREFLLGGVTRGILSSMTVPALMSH